MKIIMYSAAWCSDCVYAKKYLDEHNIHYEYIDVTNNTEATELVKKINNGKRIIPTFIIDGEIYANPGISKLSNIIKQ
ncbi:glutaredoxin family protein [Flavobacteriales bacterium]|nr:glutaredoxin family protein [Flavobacteriales bacterium]MDC1063228.1 glutaredoxin family protein [Flavobacteriales bacterium]|tara:strand:+ start:298 stop:531 length:234 start_codon:yes stop_codon:yes gene_type:complete